MRKLSATLAGLALAATLSGALAGPASAAAVTSMPRHHRFQGQDSGDEPGEGRSHYDREAHDDPTLF